MLLLTLTTSRLLRGSVGCVGLVYVVAGKRKKTKEALVYQSHWSFNGISRCKEVWRLQVEVQCNFCASVG